MKSTLWTILNENGWQELQSKGVLRCPLRLIDLDFKVGYDWMRIQMYERIGIPSQSDQYPLWAWYQFKSVHKKIPDLRESGYLPSGTHGYRIKLKKDTKEILFSDFDLWHFVLNKSHIPASLIESELFSPKYDHILRSLGFNEYPNASKTKIQTSWKKIFDLDFQVRDISLPREMKPIQATFWELKTEEVLKVDRFIAR